MTDYWHAILNSWEELSLWVIGFFAVFTALAQFTPCNHNQSAWRKDMFTDLVYFFILPILNRFVHIAFLAAGLYFIFYGVDDEVVMEYVQTGFGPLATLPIWLQAAIIFLVSDFLLYWLHRLFHEMPLWKYHAIHHSSERVDWLSTYRFHPVNTWFCFTLVDAAMLLVGFSPAAIAAMSVVNMIYSAMVHANLNWTFGPFKYLFASPVFHRWHHTAQEEGMNKNFAPTFPLLDIMFGTFYMPENRLPERFGVPGSNIPPGFVGQIIWPFKQK